MTSILSFIQDYPDPDDKLLIPKISNLKEFNELTLTSDETRSDSPGVPMNHQELQARYISQHTLYNSEIIWHGLGTGKTFVISLIVERLKNTLIGGYPRKPALILVKNEGLADSMRREISLIATKGQYLPKPTREEIKKMEETGEPIDLSERAKMERLKSAISKTYNIVTFGELLSTRNMPNDERIKLEYTNIEIIVDEAQNIRYQPGTSEQSTMYNNLHHFLHTVVECRICLSTATPIWDKVYDIASLFNLILPLGKQQLPTLNNFVKEYFDSDQILKPLKAEELRNRLRGKITYVRPLESTAVRKEIGVKAPWMEHIVVFPSALSKFQSNFVLEAMNTYKEKKEKKPGPKEKGELPLAIRLEGGANAFLIESRDAATCVYPEFDEKGEVIGGVYGTKGFLKYAVSKKSKITVVGGKNKKVFYDGYGFNNINLANAFRPASGSDPFINLRRYSTKIATIIEMLIDPERITEKAFIYSESVRGTGGIISVALIFQLWNFKWIKNTKSKKELKIQEILTPKNPGTFIVISSDDQTTHSPKDIRELLKLCNDDENLYGQFLRVVIGSETISQGYTLKGFKQAHSISGDWNLPTSDQAFGRVYRTGSHNQFKDEKDRFLNIYRHVSVDICSAQKSKKKLECITFKKGVSNPSGGTFNTKQTLDTHIYGIAERKEFLNSQIYRLMKSVAWDCVLTYKRNVLVNDVDGTRACDFGECNYVCDGFGSSNGLKMINKGGRVWDYHISKKEIDSTNYNLFYSEATTKDNIQKLKLLFNNYFSLTIESIALLLDIDTSSGEYSIDNSMVLIIKALKYMIDNQTPVYNRFGEISILREIGSVFYLDHYPTLPYVYFTEDSSIIGKNKYSNIIPYHTFNLVSENAKFDDVLEMLLLENDLPIIKTLSCDTTKSRDEFLEIFGKLSHKTKVVLIEDSLQKKFSTKSHKKENQLNPFIFKTTLAKNELFEMSDGNFVHNMYNSEYTGVDYDVISQILKPNGKIRVFDMEDREWNYVSPNREEDYIREIRALIENRKNKNFKDNPYKIYGKYSSGGKFQIVNATKGKKSKGMVCMSQTEEELYNLIKSLNHLPFEDEIDDEAKDKSKNELIPLILSNKEFLKSSFASATQQESKIVLEEMSVLELQKLYSLFELNKTRLCNSLERFFKGENEFGLNLISEK